MIEPYLLLKTLHIISFVAWFAGLFYAPRLFVYHAEHPSAGKVLAVMEYKLLRYIMLPAALATWGFGLALVSRAPYLMQMGWLHAKLGLVVVLTGYHVSLEAHRRAFAAGKNKKSGRYFRMYNEVPTLVLIVVVALAVFKPF
jgi:protoporphyrinogen IX oxidase